MEPELVASGDACDLRHDVLASLRSQGFAVANGRLISPVAMSKPDLRALHSQAVAGKRAGAEGSLARHESVFLRNLTTGSAVDIAAIDPYLVRLSDRRNLDAKLWRWCALHWSVPISSGYGRRLRFLVRDRGHGDALMGIIGLGDPVFALRARDHFIGWTPTQRAENLIRVMDAFALGSVPPYDKVLGSKLIALLATSDEVRRAFAEQYAGSTSRMRRRTLSPELTIITTTSALGKSSVYNRLTGPDGRLRFKPAGYSVGSGDFHFDVVYEQLKQLAKSSEHLRSASPDWKAGGARNRRDVIQAGLKELGLDGHSLRVHGIKRQIFVAELADNSRALLTDSETTARWNSPPVRELSRYWLDRWALPRSRRTEGTMSFDPASWRLWPAASRQ